MISLKSFIEKKTDTETLIEQSPCFAARIQVDGSAYIYRKNGLDAGTFSLSAEQIRMLYNVSRKVNSTLQ